MSGEDNKTILILREYIKISENRTKIMEVLNIGSQSPSKIAKTTGISVSTVSRILRELKEKGYVHILNPKERKGRLYGLTEKGNLVMEHIDEDLK